MNHDIIIHNDVEQGTQEWFEARAGKVTASRLKDVMAMNQKRTGPGLTRQTYMRQLAGEIISGVPMETFQSQSMMRGKEMEVEARLSYELTREVETEQIGFVEAPDMRAGCSPDSFVGEGGLLEIKTHKPDILIDYLMESNGRLREEPPALHRKQVQAQLWITGRQWCDLLLYYTGMPMGVFRIERDTGMISDIENAVAGFNSDLDIIVRALREMRK